MEATLAEFGTWMASHHFPVNDSETKIIIFGSQNQWSKVNIEGVLVGSSVIKSVRNLGAW